MKPGRELDALVAERVMGCEQPFSMDYVPEYSTDIKAAWELVELLINDFGMKIITTPDPGAPVGWLVVFSRWRKERFSDYSGYGTESAAHAICLAALKVKGVSL